MHWLLTTHVRRYLKCYRSIARYRQQRGTWGQALFLAFR